MTGGREKTPGNNTDITSLRAENGGLLDTLLPVKAMEIYYGRQTSSLPLPIHIDNTKMVKRGQTSPP